MINPCNPMRLMVSQVTSHSFMEQKVFLNLPLKHCCYKLEMSWGSKAAAGLL